MRVLLISANTEQVNVPVFPLGLACVATAVKNAGHEVNLISLMDEEDKNDYLEEGIKSFKPEAIGISVRNIDDQSRLNTKFLLESVKGVMDSCRSLSGAPVILGGAGYSIFPQSALAFLGADMGIQGEGEKAFPVLLERLEQKKDIDRIPGLNLLSKGIYHKPDFIKNLDAFPLPLPDAFPWIPAEAKENKNAWIPFQTRRGCAMDCSYCSTSTIEGRILRKHTPEHVVKMLGYYVEAGYQRFQFVDNTFNLPPSYAEALCDKILESGLDIKWLCILYPSKMPGRLTEKMAQAGCRGVSIGFESGSDKMLRGFNKKFSLEDIRGMTMALKDAGIRTMGFLLLGGPGETRETVEESLAFVDGLPLDSLKITTGIRIYPYTALARRAVEDGLIKPDDDLLYPKFYMVKGLESWLSDTVARAVKDRPHWME